MNLNQLFLTACFLPFFWAIYLLILCCVILIAASLSGSVSNCQSRVSNLSDKLTHIKEKCTESLAEDMTPAVQSDDNVKSSPAERFECEATDLYIQP